MGFRFEFSDLFQCVMKQLKCGNYASYITMRGFSGLILGLCDAEVETEGLD